MNANHFRAATWALIAFNILGTILSWADHLQKPGTNDASAITSGTQLASPLILVAIGIIALVLTYSARRGLAVTGISLLALYGVVFAFGETTEFFKHNIGVSTGRWDIIIIGCVIGAIIGITEAILCVQALVRTRRANRPLAAPAN